MVLARALYSEDHGAIQLRTTMPAGLRQGKAVFLWAADRSVTQPRQSPIIPSSHYSQRVRRCQSTWPRRQGPLVFGAVGDGGQAAPLGFGLQEVWHALAASRAWPGRSPVCALEPSVISHHRCCAVGDGLRGDRARVSTGHSRTSPSAGAGPWPIETPSHGWRDWLPAVGWRLPHSSRLPPVGCSAGTGVGAHRDSTRTRHDAG